MLKGTCTSSVMKTLCGSKPSLRFGVQTSVCMAFAAFWTCRLKSARRANARNEPTDLSHRRFAGVAEDDGADGGGAVGEELAFEEDEQRRARAGRFGLGADETAVGIGVEDDHGDRLGSGRAEDPADPCGGDPI